jgi:hypothetical protein
MKGILPKGVKIPPEVTTLSQEFETKQGQWNRAVRALKIGDTYAEIHLRPEGDNWKCQCAPTLKVVHPRHGEIQLFCPIPTTKWPGTYSSDGAAKTVALMGALEELTVYLQMWVRDFA